MTSLNINLIGAGAVGKALGRLIVTHQLAHVKGICNLTKTSALNAIEFIGEGASYTEISQLPPAKITFITTPDDTIQTACELLNQNKNIKSGDIIVHCSGVLSSDVLVSLKQRGCHIASIHPMRSFADPQLSVMQYQGTYCAIEGDEEAILTLSNLFNSFGSVTYRINKQKKALYHAAGVFASNYLVTLAQQALTCLSLAEVEENLTIPIITQIMQNTVTNLIHCASPSAALTGPLKRGDHQTINTHLDALPLAAKEIYKALGKETLKLTSLDEKKKKLLFNLLSDAKER